MVKTQKKTVSSAATQSVKMPIKTKQTAKVSKPPSCDEPLRSKQGMLKAMLERSTGATVEEIAKATGWQKHSVLGTISGVLRKRMGLTFDSVVEPRGRVYRII